MVEEKTRIRKSSKEDFEEDESKIYEGKELLIDIETYLKSGVHIGTKFKSGEMKRYIFKKRKDGLMVFNIETIDKRIRMIAKELAKYEPHDIAVVCRKLYGQKAIKKFASMTGTKAYTGRFIPGTITNPEARSFYEPRVILLCDTLNDSQALKEAFESHIPIISLVGSESPLKGVDIALPVNNKGRKSLALIFYLLTRELLVERKEIDRKTFDAKIEDFEQEMEKSEKRSAPVFNRRPRRR